MKFWIKQNSKDYKRVSGEERDELVAYRGFLIYKIILYGTVMVTVADVTFVKSLENIT